MRKIVSVLALSSRFDGLRSFNACICSLVKFQYSLCRVVLMVYPFINNGSYCILFQYSLCRVVLMVPACCSSQCSHCAFQYSLCRVVLMVFFIHFTLFPFFSVSVLALSSRFDGRCASLIQWNHITVSVLALSSRFDGHLALCPFTIAHPRFQYSLCRVVLMVTKMDRCWRG